MRARYPVDEGFVDSHGVKIAYEVYGAGSRTVVLPPLDPIVHSRAWKAQIPYLSRFARVVTIDPRGNGRSEAPVGPEAYAPDLIVDDTLTVMDAVGVEQALLVGLCTSSWFSVLLAAGHPERVSGVVSIASWIPRLTPPFPGRTVHPFDQPLDTDEGWAKDNKYYWQRDWSGYVDFFFDQLLPEPHSTKQFEDCVRWAHETPSVQAQIDNSETSLGLGTREEVVAVLREVPCPVLAIHGDADLCQPLGRSSELAAITGGRLVVLEGAGHLPQARHPVVVNHLIKDFLDEVVPVAAPAPRRWRTAATRRPTALFVSSPIGLGHSRRDLAIAQAFRERRPEVQVDWFTQQPVIDFLARAGERVHPACAWLASESAHWEGECGEHDLHAFQALRRMDEILVHNFMLFDEVLRDEHYDLVIADEAWDVDHFLHENPELKTSALAWLTDFVGFLPFADGGEREAALTTDYNAEMVELVARTPRLRDRSLFVGDVEDIVPDGLGAGLPSIRDWTTEHFEFPGYVTGFDPIPAEDVAGVREELGYADGEQVCIVSVGGSGVGLDLLRRTVEAFPEVRRRVPGLRMVLVTGPRIDPAQLGAAPREGLDVRRYVDDLWRHLSVCDLAVVQAGLTTTMELVAARRPFAYVPLRHHFEQQFHVAHRLQRYRAGPPLDYDEIDPDHLADVVAERIGGPVDYLPVTPGAAERVADRLVDLV